MGCRIVLDCPHKVHAGNKVSGRVQCKFCVHENIKEIRCVLKGLELIGSHPHKAKEFFNRKQTLVPRGILKPGRYEYPFSIDLPTDIPSSFEDHPALVQYILKAVVDIPSNSQEDVVILQVCANVDLRKFEKNLTMKPFSIESSSNRVGCCCWSSTPIEMSMSLEKNAFLVGETINVKIHVQNNSVYKMESLSVCLKRIFEYKNNESDKRSHSRVKEIIANECLSGVEGNEEQTIYSRITIPPYTEVYSFILCHCVKEVFLLQADGSARTSHVTVQIPIFLGHIGLPIIEEAGGTGEGLSDSRSRSRYFPSMESRSRHGTSHNTLRQDRQDLAHHIPPSEGNITYTRPRTAIFYPTQTPTTPVSSLEQPNYTSISEQQNIGTHLKQEHYGPQQQSFGNTVQQSFGNVQQENFGNAQQPSFVPATQQSVNGSGVQDHVHYPPQGGALPSIIEPPSMYESSEQ